MQALIELLSGFIALLASAALSQFGVDLNRPEPPAREVHRVQDCRGAPDAAVDVQRPAPRC
jgi:hypothetical protein